jgi:inorganic pyrophosphatase
MRSDPFAGVAFMKMAPNEPSLDLLRHLVRAHPWHGVRLGSDAPERVTVFIEIVPTDTVKFELDKESGFLRLDRPQRFSNVCPTLYGFMPQTFCGPSVAQYTAEKIGEEGITGDGDPLDICVLTEKTILHGDILLEAIPIGGLRMIDREEVDDKIIAVLHGDATYGEWTSLGDCPKHVLDRLEHYFLTYKDVPGAKRTKVRITHAYQAEEAREVIRRANQDYLKKYADLAAILAKLQD